MSSFRRSGSAYEPGSFQPQIAASLRSYSVRKQSQRRTPVIASVARRSAFSNLKSKLQIATSLRSYSVRKQSQRRVLPSHRARRVSRTAFAKRSLAAKNGRVKCGDLTVKSLARSGDRREQRLTLCQHFAGLKFATWPTVALRAALQTNVPVRSGDLSQQSKCEAGLDLTGSLRALSDQVFPTPAGLKTRLDSKSTS